MNRRSRTTQKYLSKKWNLPGVRPNIRRKKNFSRRLEESIRNLRYILKFLKFDYLTSQQKFGIFKKFIKLTLKDQRKCKVAMVKFDSFNKRSQLEDFISRKLNKKIIKVQKKKLR
jgi:hypothetical protein